MQLGGNVAFMVKGGSIKFDVSIVIVRYHVMDIIPVVTIGIIGGYWESFMVNLLHKVLRLYNLINQ